jgi:hypothetical protein
MTQQLRPISGGTANGAPIACLAAGTVVHTVPAVSAERMGPVIDQISLFLSNTTAGAATAAVLIGSTSFDVAIPANDFVEVLVNQPVLGTVATAVTVTVAHSVADNGVVAWGHFTRA